MYGFPLVLALILAAAFPNRPVAAIKVDVVGTDDTATTLATNWSERDLTPKLEATSHAEEEALRRLRTAKTSLVVYADKSAPAGYRLVSDDSQPGSVLARAAVESIILRDANPKAQLPEAKPLSEALPDTTGGRYFDFLLPGLIGTNLMGGGLFGVGFLIVDMRVRKLLKRYLATPMRKSDFMLSLVISRLIFTVSEIGVLLAVAHLPFEYFGLRVHGNWFALIFLILLGGASFSGLGLLVASRARTMETASGLLNAVMLPQYLVSGVFFSSTSFPDFLQPFIKVLPLTALNDGLRAIINDGAGFEAILWPTVILLSWGLVSFFAAIKLFKWR